jgi:hypothetical protein
MNRHDLILQFFEFKHLPEKLQRVSAPFHALANALVTSLPSNPERTTAMRKLLEAKDAAVRAAIFQFPDPAVDPKSELQS